MTTKRKIIGLSTNNQGVDEEITWTLDVSTWPSPPPNAGAVTITVKDADGTDVTATIVPGSITVSGNDISFQTKDGTAGHQYRVEVKWTGNDADIYEAFGILDFEV